MLQKSTFTHLTVFWCIRKKNQGPTFFVHICARLASCPQVRSSCQCKSALINLPKTHVLRSSNRHNPHSRSFLPLYTRLYGQSIDASLSKKKIKISNFSPKKGISKYFVLKNYTRSQSKKTSFFKKVKKTISKSYKSIKKLNFSKKIKKSSYLILSSILIRKFR